MPTFDGTELATGLTVVGGLLTTGLAIVVGRTIYRMTRSGAGEASV